VIHDPALLDELERLVTRPFYGRAWRHMFNGLDPQLSNTRGARWNPPGIAAVYLSLESATAIAEADHSLNTQPVRPTPKSRELYEVEIELQRVLDIREEGVLERLGVDADALRRYPSGECQAVGGGAAWLDFDGLLVPSGRASGSNLVAFVDHMDPDATLTIIERTELPLE
jgi:RES domain-containing protein